VGETVGQSNREPFVVGSHRVDPMANEIDGAHVDSKAMDVLVCLAEAAPAVVDSRTIFERVWPRVVVGDNVLHQAIRHLRQALGDDARAPACIENIPRRGYRIVARVRWTDGPSPDSAQEDAATATANGSSAGGARAGRRKWLAIAVALVAAGAVGLASFVPFERIVPGDAPSVADTRSLAVLRFSTPDRESGLDATAAHLVDDIVVELDDYPAPRIAAPGTGITGPDDRAIARSLGVGYLLDGRLRTDGERVRTSVRVVRGSDGFQVWSEHYDRTTHELVDTRRLAKSIAYAARTRVLTDDNEQTYWLRDRPDYDPIAITHWLQARREFRSLIEGQGGSWDLVMSLYEKAVDVDPSLYAAHLMIADSMTYLVGWRVPIDQARTRAYTALQRAFALVRRGTDPLGLLILGKVEFLLDLDYDAARTAFEAALALDPEFVHAPAWLSFVCAAAGDRDATAKFLHLQRRTLSVYESEPRELLLTHFAIGQHHFAAGEFALARDVWTDALELTESRRHDAALLRYIAWAEAKLGRDHAAASAVDRAWALTGADDPHAYIGVLALVGRAEQARQLLATWDPDDPAQRGPPLFARPNYREIAVNYLLVGDLDNTVKWLRRSIAERDTWFFHLRTSLWDPMRTDARFMELLRHLEAEEARSRREGRVVRARYLG
jgi:DNA-binding winged helix-turn-helix (wHTH) protein/TolB-like protein